MDSVRNDPELATEVITLLGKELKVAREQIKKLQGQIRLQEVRGDSVTTDDSREFRKRAKAAEASSGVLKAEVETLSVENTVLKLSLEKWLRVKQEDVEDKYSIPPPEEQLGAELPTVDLAEKVKELEEALKVYYGKYKVQKEAKQALRKSLAELETRVKDLTQENQQLRQSAESTSSSKPPGRCDFVSFMNKFPQCDTRPHFSRLFPVCYRGVDITAYLESDSKLAKYSNNFLYLPGRLLWFGSSQHGFAYGPQHVLDTSTGHWKKKSTFEEQYGKSFELFYLSKNRIYYAGLYTCHNLRSWSPEGSSMPTEKVIHPEVLAQVTLENCDSTTDNSEHRSLEKNIERLYLCRVLKVEVMGLQCIGFNAELYDALDRRFQASLPVLGKREGSQSEGRQSTKKIRTT